MAKPTSTERLSGKVGDQVHMDGKYGSLVRRVRKDGGNKSDSRSIEQNARTSYLNELASDLNRIIGKYAAHLKRSTFISQCKAVSVVRN